MSESDDLTMRRLHVGCGRNIKAGWINLDRTAAPGVDVVADLDRCREQPLPFPDDHFDLILAEHVLEHVHDPLGMMAELHRVAKPGATAVLRVPYGSHDDAYTDPTHVRPYFIESWAYFGQPNYWRADYGYRGDWQPETIELMMEPAIIAGRTMAEIRHAVQYERNTVVEMAATMTAIKPCRPADCNLQQEPAITIRAAVFGRPAASTSAHGVTLRANQTKGRQE